MILSILVVWPEDRGLVFQKLLERQEWLFPIFVNEIPKYTKAKMEVATKEVMSYLLDCYYVRYIYIYTHLQ